MSVKVIVESYNVKLVLCTVCGNSVMIEKRNSVSITTLDLCIRLMGRKNKSVFVYQRWEFSDGSTLNNSRGPLKNIK